MRILLSILFCISLPAQSIEIDLAKSGPTTWQQPDLTTTVWAAASAFRNVANPISKVILAGTILKALWPTDGLKMTTQAMRPTPPGWSSPDGPPATASMCYYVSPGCWSSPEGACAGYSWASPWVYDHVEGTRCFIRNSTTGAVQGSSWASMGCPAGYTNNAGTCILSSPSTVKWPNDNETTYVPTGSGWAPDPRDSDTAPTFKSGSGTPPSSTAPFTQTGPDIYNNPTHTTVTPTSDGGFDFSRSTQSQDANTGQPYVQKDNVHADSNGVVTQSGSTTFANTTISDVINNTIPTQTPNLSIDTSTLAKEATLQSTNTKLDKLHDDLTVTPQTPPDVTNTLRNQWDNLNTSISTVPTDYANQAPQITETLPYNYALGVCTPLDWPVTIMGHEYHITLERFCQIYNDHVVTLLEYMINFWALIFLFNKFYDDVKEI